MGEARFTPEGFMLSGGRPVSLSGLVRAGLPLWMLKTSAWTSGCIIINRAANDTRTAMLLRILLPD